MYIYKRNSIYHYRIVIPKNIMHLFGKKELHKSLKTKSKLLALKYAKILNENFQYIRQSIMMNKLSDKEIRQAIYNFVALKFEEADKELYFHPNPKDTLDWQFDGWQEKVKILKEQITFENYSDDITNEAKAVLEIVGKSAVKNIDSVCKKLAEGHIQNILTIINKIDKDIYTTTLNPYSTDFITTTLNSHHSANIHPELIPSPPLPSIVVAPDITLKELTDKYINHTNDERKWTKDNLKDNTNSLKLLLLHYGDNFNVKDIDRKSLLDFRSLVLKIPTQFALKTEYKALTTLQAIIDKASEKKAKIISKNVVGKHLGRLSSFFHYCMINDYIDKNPFIDLSIDTGNSKNSRRGYNNNEIELLFKTPTYTQDLEKTLQENPQHIFIPLIAMYTGMRMNEICQLYKTDIKIIDKVWSIDINRSLDKSVKNDDSVRKIPIHSKLIEAGFLKYIDSIETQRLWPNLKKYEKYANNEDGEGLYSKDFSKWYRTKINRKHITEDKQVVFHSFRHNTAIKLINKKVQGPHIAEILGHTQDLNMTFSRYGERISPALLQDEIEQISYSDVLSLEEFIKKISMFYRLNP